MKYQVMYFLFVLIFPTQSFARVVHYDPSITECTGTVTLQYFPGPPNYESIKEGDEKEGAYILKLNEILDVVPTKDPNEPPNSDWEKNVKVFQLLVIGDKIKGFGKYVGKKISVRGKLFHAFTGHHHARILMELEKVWE